MNFYFPSNPNWVDYLAYGLITVFMLLVVGVAAILIYSLLSWLFTIIFYNFSYSAPVTYPGKVIDMKYIPPQIYTQIHNSNKTSYTTTHTTPEKNQVTFQTEKATTTIDSEELYQRVRIGEDIKVISQSEYIKPKYWDGKWEYKGERLIRILCYKDQIVEFNDEK